MQSDPSLIAGAFVLLTALLGVGIRFLYGAVDRARKWDKDRTKADKEEIRSAQALARYWHTYSMSCIREMIDNGISPPTVPPLPDELDHPIPPPASN